MRNLKLIISSLLILGTVLGISSMTPPAQKAKAYTYTVNPNRPRIWMTAGNIDSLRARAVTNPDTWQALKSDASTAYGKTVGDGSAKDVYPLALASRILETSSPTTAKNYATKAIEIMDYFLIHKVGIKGIHDTVDYDSNGNLICTCWKNNICESTTTFCNTSSGNSPGYRVREVAPFIIAGYDWLYNSLSADEKITFANKLLLWRDWYIYYPDQGVSDSKVGTVNNWNTVYALSEMMTGIALSGVNGFEVQSNNLINHALSFYYDTRFKPILTTEAKMGLPSKTYNYTVSPSNSNWPYYYQQSGAAGGWMPEGSGYGAFSVNQIMLMMAAYKSATGQDLFRDTPYPEGLAKYILNYTLPGRDGFWATGDMSGSPSTGTGYLSEYDSTVLDILSGEFKTELGPEIQYWLSHGRRTLNSTYEFLFYDANAPAATNFNKLPLNYRVTGNQDIFSRSSWATDALWLVFQGGDNWTGRPQYGDYGNFAIWKNGWLIPQAGGMETGSDSRSVLTYVAENRAQNWTYPGNFSRRVNENPGPVDRSSTYRFSAPTFLTSAKSSTSNDIAITSGSPYTLSGYIYLASDFSGKVNLNIAGGCSAEPDYTKRDSWQRVSCQFTPSGEKINISIVADLGTKGTAYFDALQLQKGDLTDYVKNGQDSITCITSVNILPNSSFENPMSGGQKSTMVRPGASLLYYDTDNQNYIYAQSELANSYKDAGTAYDANPFSSWRRNIVQLNPNYVVVFDSVSTTSLNFKPRMLFQYPFTKPTIDGNTISDTSNNGQGKIFQKTLLPTEPVISASDHFPCQADPETVNIGWQARVQPKDTHQTESFLNVFQATDPLTATMVATNKIESEEQNASGEKTAVGAQIGDRVVMFSTGDKIDGYVTYNLSSGSGISKQLLTGLRTSYPYDIYFNNTKIKTANSTDQGTLAFDVTLGSANTIKVAPQNVPSINITKSADKSSAKSGDIITYTLNYSNSGTVGATNAKIEDPIPTGTTFDSIVSGGAIYDSANNKIILNIGSLVAGATGTIQFKVKVD